MIAPTGTIGLVMDCDTTGIEPDFAIVKFKKLAGGGYFKIINRVVPEALEQLGYDQSQIDDIINYAVGSGSLKTVSLYRLTRCVTKASAMLKLTRLKPALAAPLISNSYSTTTRSAPISARRSLV